MPRLMVFALLVLLLGSVAAAAAPAAAVPATTPAPVATPLYVPAAAQPSDHFNADAATEAYLAEMPPAAKARSDAYFEGGYWLILWDFLYGAVISLLLLNLGWSARIRDLAETMTQARPVQTAIYWVAYLLLTTLLGFPLAVYEGYFREHTYGLATQTFGPWLGDQAKGLGIGLVFGAILTVILFGVVRRLSRTWWIWGAVVTMLFLIIGQIIAPVYLFPLFNDIKPLNDPRVTQPILRMAHANGIPVKDVYEIDASRQSTRMSANVSGFAGTMRITLNDNLLHRGSPEQIQAVMGHEMGHYVLNHVYIGFLFFLIVIVTAFALLRWALDWCLARWGGKWKIRGIGDIAVLPLVTLLASIFFFLMTPVLNSFVRTQEHEADMYGINASRQPDGFAQAALQVSEYRKMSPGPLEEVIFFDHPSGRRRIHDAMQWKGENLTK